MGFFSWLTSDTNKSIANVYSSRSTFPVYVLIPEEFGGGYIEEKAYDGYGVFGGHDVYNLVADWNKTHISTDNIKKPVREHWSADEQGESWYKSAVERYERECLMVKEFCEGADDKYMKETYGEDYKRIIGINIACYDEQNAALEYPIKFVENKSIAYEDATPSESCPDQGFFYDDCEDEDY